jgi:Winged helix DNA-binding domain
LGAEGRIARGRPRGSWISSQFQWSLVEDWLPGGIPELPVEDAQAALARHWLAQYGPGTLADLRWWAGWTATQAKKTVANLGAVEVALDGGTGLVLPDDVEPVPEPEPWAALLPGLDPTPMGWVERGWYLGEHAPELFDRTGNIGPTVWWNGRIVGGWAQRPDGEIAVSLLEKPGRTADKAINEAADRLRTWLGDIRVTPRFRTPLERTLSA